MNYNAILQEVCSDVDRWDVHWLEHMTQQPALRDMLEEWVLVRDAFARWSKVEGRGTHEFEQYKALMIERSQEIEAFIQRVKPSGKNSHS